MRSSGSMRTEIGTLIIATSVVQLANGFFGTFISLRVAIEDFGPTLAGLVLSSYFAGFTIGALRCGRIIERVGHIRAYAAFAGLVVAATAAMPLLSRPAAVAGPARDHRVRLRRAFRHDRELAQRQGQPSERGRSVLDLHGRHLPGPRVGTAPDRPGQDRDRRHLSTRSSPCSPWRWCIVSTTRAEPPRATAVARLPYGQLSRAAPVAVAGCALSGLITSSFYALVPAWMQGEQHRTRDHRALHAGRRARRTGVPDSGRPAFGPARPTSSCWRHSASASRPPP